MATTIRALVPWYVDKSTAQNGSPNITMLTVPAVWTQLGIGDSISQFVATASCDPNAVVYGDRPAQVSALHLAERFKVLNALEATTLAADIFQRKHGSDYSGKINWLEVITSAENSYENNGGGLGPVGTWDTYSAASWSRDFPVTPYYYRPTIIRVIKGGVTVVVSGDFISNLTSVAVYMSATKYTELGEQNFDFDANGLSGLTAGWVWNQVGTPFSGPFQSGQELLFLNNASLPVVCTDPRYHTPPGSMRGYVTKRPRDPDDPEGPDDEERVPYAIANWAFGYLTTDLPSGLCKVDIKQTEINVCRGGANGTLNLTADSYWGSGMAQWSSQPSGISGSGSSISFSPANLTAGITYTVTARAGSCYDTCLVRVIKVDMTAYRPQNLDGNYPLREDFPRIAVPDEKEESPGAGIRANGESIDENLIEVILTREPPSVSGISYFIKRQNSRLKVWEDNARTTVLLDSSDEVDITGKTYPLTLWVEYPYSAFDPAPEDCELLFEARYASSVVFCSDKVLFYPFESVVIGLSGEDWPAFGTGPFPPADNGFYVLSKKLYEDGYDVHYFDEDAVAGVPTAGSGEALTQVMSAFIFRHVRNCGLVGTSHGGGSAHDLAEAINSGIPGMNIKYTAYADANVNLPPALFMTLTASTAPETRKPPGTAYHVNCYETLGSSASWSGIVIGLLGFDLIGAPVPGSDHEVHVTAQPWGASVYHGDIEDNENVHNIIIEKLKANLER